MRIVNLSKHFVSAVSGTMFWRRTDGGAMAGVAMCLVSGGNCRGYTQQNGLQRFLSNHYQ